VDQNSAKVIHKVACGQPVIYKGDIVAQPFTETEVEQAALAWLESMGYLILWGPEIAPGELRLPAALRDRAALAGVPDAERIVGRCV
jgi:hypothetical protein